MVVADREAITVLAADRLLLHLDVVVEAKRQERDAGGSNDRLRERVGGGSSGGLGNATRVAAPMDRESATGVAAPVAGVVSNGKERCVMERTRAGKAQQQWKRET